MAFPSAAIARVEMSVGIRELDLEASRRGFIGPQIAVPVLVGRQSGTLGKVALGQMMKKTVAAPRAPGAGYARDSFTFGTFDFACQEYGAEEPLDDASLRMYADVLDAETIHAGRAIDRVLRPFEVAVATLIYDTAVWTGADLTTAIGNEWDDATNATPIDDVEEAAQKIYEATGYYPNCLALNRKQFNAVRNTDQVKERILYGGGPAAPAVVSEAALATILGLDRVAVASGAKNVATEGQEVDLDPIWSDEYAMLCRVGTSPDVAEPCIARTFLWPGDGAGDGGDQELAVLLEEYREEAVRGSVLRARTYYQAKVLIPAMGHLLSNVLTI